MSRPSRLRSFSRSQSGARLVTVNGQVFVEDDENQLVTINGQVYEQWPDDRVFTPASVPGATVNLTGQSVTASYGTITVDTGITTVVLSNQEITASQGTVTVSASAGVNLGAQQITANYGTITVDTGAATWSITDVDTDEAVYDGQTGVVVSISQAIAASGKKVWIEQGGDWVEQSVTAEDATSATITVDYGGSLAPGSATLYVRNPL